MKNIKTFIVLFLCAAMLVPMLVSCGNGQSTPTNSTPPEVNPDETPTSVPYDLKFEGETFTILCREDNAYGKYLYEIMADENETELVNQAVYERNLKVEERFGIDLIARDIPGSWSQSGDFVNTFRNSIMAGAQEFDLIMSQQAYMCDLGLSELYLNFYDVPYISEDINKPYFFQDNIKELSVDGKLFYLVGDYSLTYWEFLYVMYFNKQIAQNENLEDIYQLVRSGDWTIDKCIELSRGVYRDVDGDGHASENDLFGYITDYENTSDALFSQFDVQATGRDEEENVVMAMDQGKMVSILEKMIAFYNTEDVFTHKTSSTDTENPFDTIFTEDRALFYPERLARAKDYRDMETPFGIIPFPKWDENQQGYYTQAQNAYSVAVVPIDVKDSEMTGAVLDVLSALSYDYVTPAYYDMALKNKFARDEESGEMLDLIRKGIKINFGYFYYKELETGGIIRLLLNQKNSNFVSYYAAHSKGYERNLKKIVSSYIKND